MNKRLLTETEAGLITGGCPADECIRGLTEEQDAKTLSALSEGGLISDEEIERCVLGIPVGRRGEQEIIHRREAFRRVAKAQAIHSEARCQKEKQEDKKRIFKIMDSLIFEIDREAFGEPQIIPQSGREPVTICLTLDNWENIKQAYQNFKKQELG